MRLSTFIRRINESNIVVILDRDKDKPVFTGCPKDIPPEYYVEDVNSIHSESLELYIAELENVYPQYPGKIVSMTSAIVIEIR